MAPVTISTIQVKRSFTSGTLPKSLLEGEEFVNLADGFRLTGDGVTPPADLPRIPHIPADSLPLSQAATSALQQKLDADGDASAVTVALPDGTTLPLPNAFRPIAESARTFAIVDLAASRDLTNDAQVIITRRSFGSRPRPSLYCKVNAQPAHGACFRDAKGAWFEYAETEIHVYAMGALGANAADDAPAFQLAADVAAARGGGVICAEGDKFILGSTVSLYSSFTFLRTSGSLLYRTGTTGDVVHFGPKNPGPDDLLSNVGVSGGTFAQLDPNVTAGAGVAFERCQSFTAEHVSAYSCFEGFRVAACVNGSIVNPVTDCGINWTGVKPGSAGIKLTGIAGSTHRNSAIEIVGGSASGNTTARNVESSLRIEEVDGLKATGTYLSFAKYTLSLIPFSDTSPLTLIELINVGFDSPTDRHIYAPFKASYAGAYGVNSIDGGYFYNAPSIAQFELTSTGAGLQFPCWSVRVKKCFHIQGDGIFVAGGAGYDLDCNFADMNVSGNGGSCFRIYGAKNVTIGGIYTKLSGDAHSPYHFVSLEAGTDYVNIKPYTYLTDPAAVGYLSAVARDATCGPNMKIAEGLSNETTVVASAATLSVPASLRTITLTGTAALTGLDASSSWKGRRLLILIQDGLPLTSGGSFVVKGGSRTAQAGEVIELICFDGVIWREV